MTLLFDVRALTPTATADQLGDSLALAAALDARAVCVLPNMLATVQNLHNELHAETGAAVPISTVAGWPTGAHHTLVKASEARLAVDSGAQEVTVVLNPAAVIAGDATALLSEAVTLRQAVPSPLLLTLGFDLGALGAATGVSTAQLIAAVQAVVPAGADGITLFRSDSGEIRAEVCAAVKAVLPPGVGLRIDTPAPKNPQLAMEYAAAGVGVLAVPDPTSLSIGP